jgi:hypothetical protein
MQQELARVLAWAWADNDEDSPWRGVDRLREYAIASIRYYARCMHPDGSLDDYFPWERALGATAYATAAVADACALLGWEPDAVVREALMRAGRFMASHEESGVLANHHAIAACALLGIAGVTREAGFEDLARHKISFLVGLQHSDGWFPEYEGCDIGYQTVTLEFLARCELACPGIVPKDMLDRLVDFLRAFAHPDGSLGGEYSSRNTYNFYPGGFALLSAESDAAAEMLGLHLRGLELGAANVLEDDGLFGHTLSSSVTVLISPASRVLATSPLEPCRPFARSFEGAGLYLAGAGNLRIFGNLTKGGCFKLFRGDKLICSDTGFAGKLTDGALFCQNNPSSSIGHIEQAESKTLLRIEGCMRRYRTKRLSSASMLGLRMLCFAFGKHAWFSRFIRRLMQALLIYNKRSVPVSFMREIVLDAESITVRDRLDCSGKAKIASMYLSPDCVNMHVVTSDSFQKANLESWISCVLEGDAYYEISRSFSAVEQGLGRVDESRSPDYEDTLRGSGS